MIFVTVGSTAFDEIIEEIDSLIERGEIKDEVIAQIGRGNYIPKNMKYFRYKKNIKNYYKRAKIVISHEGAGTLFELVSLRKKIVALTNPNTITNPDLIKKFSQEGYLIYCKRIKDLSKCLKLAKKFKPRKYSKPKCFIHKKIIEFVNNI